MDKITDNIYLGSSQDGLHRKEQLKEAGITAILNVARDLTNTTTNHEEFEMYKVGLMDGGGNDPVIAACALMILNGLVKQNQKVLVHCHEGKSRSAAIVAGLLVIHKQFNTFEDAEAYVKQCRARTDINSEVKELIKSLIPK